MSSTHSLLLAGCGVLLVFVAAAPTQPAAPTLSVPNGPYRGDGTALRTLDQAVRALDMDRLGWLKADLWQQATLPTLTYLAEGTYLGGADHRLRLDLQVHVGAMTSRMQVVSDGQTLWQIEQVGGGERTVAKVELNRVLEVLQKPETSAAQRAEFYGHQFFGGPVPLLQGLRDHVTFIRQDSVVWNGKPVRLLTGMREKRSSDKDWPAHLPRQCRLFLDARTLWPHRLEWWGPGLEPAGDTLLLQVEFRNPATLQSVPEATFAYQPGRAKVSDWTQTWTNGVKDNIPGL